MTAGPLSFRSIRYATGARFGPPIPVAFDEAALGAARGPLCPQLPSRLEKVLGPQAALRQDEDCHVLTVTTNARTGRRPVVVWLHGGAYVSGGGELPWYDGDALVAEHDVVFVSITYRLGAFGYLRLPGMDGPSLGLADQIEALRWVQANIERFGGDASAITIVGQSAGAHSIQALVEWGHGGILFHRAIAQSNPYQPLLTQEKASRIGSAFLDALGCDSLSASVADILRAQASVMKLGIAPLPFGPIAPGHAISGRSFDILTGWNANDAAPFILGGRKPGWLATFPGRLATFFATHKVFARGSLALERLARASGGAAVQYRLDWKAKDNPLGACHCIELPLLWGSEAAWRQAPMIAEANPSETAKIAAALRSVWAAFAEKGPPVVAPGAIEGWLKLTSKPEIRRVDPGGD